MKTAPLLLAVLTLGCATPQNNIAPTYTSPVLYEAYNCRQIAAEMYRVNARLNDTGKKLDDTAGVDAAATVVSLFLFWPALFLIKGNDGTDVEHARLKGNLDALNQAAITQKCVGENSVTNCPDCKNALGTRTEAGSLHQSPIVNPKLPTNASNISAGMDSETAKVINFLVDNQFPLVGEPVRFKQKENRIFYEARGSGGNLTQVVCEFGVCRFRTIHD